MVYPPNVNFFAQPLFVGDMAHAIGDNVLWIRGVINQTWFLLQTYFLVWPLLLAKLSKKHGRASLEK